MGNTTEWVRMALAELGQDAPDADIKSFIRQKEPTVPQNQIGLALRKIRGQVIPKQKIKD